MSLTLEILEGHLARNRGHNEKAHRIYLAKKGTHSDRCYRCQLERKIEKVRAKLVRSRG